MSARGGGKFRTVRVLRGAFAVLFAATLTAVVIQLAFHPRPSVNLEPERQSGVPDASNVKEKVSIVQFNLAVGRMEARADRNVEVDEKTGRLEGGVVIVDHGKKGGREVRYSGDAVTYAKDWSRFLFQGHVKIVHGEITVEAADFLYEKAADSFSTSSGVTVAAPRFSGTARTGSYSLKTESFVLAGDLSLNVLPRRASVPITISGARARLEFVPHWRMGTVSGGVDFAHGRSRGTAGTAEFRQFEKSDDIETFTLAAGVKLVLEGETGAAAKGGPAAKPSVAALPEDMTLSRDFLFDRSARQEIAADSIKLLSYPEAPSIRVVEARGRCSFTFFYEAGTSTEIGGDAVDVNFNPDGTLRDMDAKGHSRVASLDRERAIVRLIEGPSMFLQKETDILKVTGEGADKARIKAGSGDAFGDVVTVLIKMDDFEIAGGARMLFTPAPAAGAPQGYFAPGEPVFIDAATVRYSSEHKRFLCWSETGSARAWQGKRVLAAREIVAAEDGSELACQGRVLSSFPHQPKDGRPEQRVEIGAAKMTYDAKANRVVYEEGASLKTGAVALACRTITVDPGEAGGEPKAMRAEGAVSITLPSRTASGERADYDLGKDMIVLTGQPVLTDKDKGVIRGDKLTFHLSDGSILVESRDRDRPVTSVIK
jgi:lipopolysaccharide export system protein LptA